MLRNLKYSKVEWRIFNFLSFFSPRLFSYIIPLGIKASFHLQFPFSQSTSLNSVKFVPLNSSIEKYSKSLLDSLLVTILCSLFQELRYLALFADKVCFVSLSISNDTKNRGIDASIYNYKKQSHSLDLRCDVTYLLHFLFSIFLKNNIPSKLLQYKTYKWY